MEEAPLLLDVPLVDAHHHFWDLDRNYHPWLVEEPMIPFRYGDYSAIRRNYLLNDLRRDAARFDLVRSVYMEAEWNPDDPLGETRWIAGLREAQGFPHAMVGQAWLNRSDVDDVLAAQAGHGFVTGIRHKPAAAARPEDVTPGAPGSMSDPVWRRGYELLERYGLDFELQVVPWHLPEAAELARDHPGTTIVLNHTGLPADRSADGLALWREGMSVLAEAPNVAVKISGIGQRNKPWSVADNREIVLETIRLFGVDRCMFASNFPVDGLCGGYATIMGGYAEIVAGFAEADRRSLFHDNAMRVYGLDG